MLHAANLVALALVASAAAQTSPTTLYGTTATGDVYTISKSTGVPSFVGSTGFATETLTASIDRRQLLTARRVGSMLEIREIDPATGTVRSVQSVPSPLERTKGIAFTSATRLVVGGVGPLGCSAAACLSYLVAIDLSTGTSGPLARTSGDAAGMAYDAHRREIDLIDASGLQLRVHNAQTLAPAGNGFVVGTGTSTSHTVEYETPFVFYVAADRLYTLDPGSLTATPVGPLFPAGLEFTGIASVCHATAFAIPRVGIPPNPSALRPFRTSLPVLGQTWDPYIDHTAFTPGATADGFLLGFAAVNLPTPFGTLLCDPAGSIGLRTGPGDSLPITIPDNCAMVGFSLFLQGVGFDPSGAVRFTNALDASIGTY